LISSQEGGNIYLDRKQERLLQGEHGEANRWAMGVLVRLGDEARSERLIPISSVHIPDWYGQRQSKAWAWLDTIVGSAELPITANPGGVDDPAALIRKKTLMALCPNKVYTFSCAPYLSGNHPAQGKHVAWGGRAAVSFVNSILGAKSETESFESALASAITGLTPERGLHLDENRNPTVAVRVPENIGSDYALLGGLVSNLVGNEIPVICGPYPPYDEAKRFAFAINGNGKVPFYKLSRKMPLVEIEKIDLEVHTWQDALIEQNSPDLLILGCPHLSEQDINRWGRFMSGHRYGRVEIWFFTSQLCLDKCPNTGAVLANRGRVMVDRCPLSMLDEIDGLMVGCDSPALASCLSAAGVEARPVPHDAIRKLMVEG
jgi:predicted aconitase